MLNVCNFFGITILTPFSFVLSMRQNMLILNFVNIPGKRSLTFKNMFYVRKIEGTEFMEINKHKFKIMMKTKKLYIFDFRMYDPNYQMFCCRNFSGI